MTLRSSRFCFLGLILVLLGPLVSSAGNVTFKDEVGREVVLSFPPKRIISLAPNITEILFDLGLDEEIVGVSIHSNFPEKARTRPRVGSYISLDYEKIISLKPNLIIATGAGNTREMVERLQKWRFPIYVIFPRNLEGIRSSIEHIGQVVGRKGEARRITSDMRGREERVVRLVHGLSRPRVFLQIGEAPIVTVGRGSFADDLIRMAGGRNVAGDEKKMYPRFGMEEILKRAPEVVLVSSMNLKSDYEKILQDWSRWKTIPAVKRGRIHLIDSDLIDRPSPRIVEGLEEMARIFHPEKAGR